MNRLLIVPGIALLAGGLYFVFSDDDSSGVSHPGVSITLGEPKQIGSSEIGTTTVTDAVEFKVIPASDSSSEKSSGEESQAEVAETDKEDSAQSEPSIQAGSSETLTSSDDKNSEDAPAVGELKPESIESAQQQASNYIKHEIVIASSLYQATNDAGLSANQTARIGKVFEPYLNVSSELRKGDRLLVILDPAAGEVENDADQVHRIEYHGARKALIITREEGSLNNYQAVDGDNVVRTDGTTPTLSSMAAEEAQQQSEESVEAVVESAADNEQATGNMRRVEGVVSVSFFSAGREAGLNAGQIENIRKILSPYINFNREMRKGDRFVVMLDGGKVYSCEYIGALKQLLATRDGQGAYKVTDKAGVNITRAESANASSETQSRKGVLPAITQSKTQAKGDARVRIKSGNSSRVESKPAVKVVRNDKSKPAVKVVRNDKSKPAAKVVRNDKSKRAVKIARTEKSSSRQVRQASPKRSDKGDSSQRSNAKGAFWKNLGFGSSTVARGNWKPKDRKLAQVFDKVAASRKVEKKALVRAFKYYQENNRSSGLAQTHIAIADYTKLATTKRLHIINLKTAGVTSVQVAHGRKSGPIGGRVTSTSNANGSNKTTKGFYRVGTKEGRTSTKGLPYLSVQGLESGNRLVGLPPRKGGRDIIIHTAGYVASGGRSLGCFSIRPQDKRLVFNKLKGVLFYSYVG